MGGEDADAVECRSTSSGSVASRQADERAMIAGCRCRDAFCFRQEGTVVRGERHRARRCTSVGVAENRYQRSEVGVEVPGPGAGTVICADVVWIGQGE